MFSYIYGQFQNNCYTLRFHSGITDDDIIKFIEKTIEINDNFEEEFIRKKQSFFEESRDQDLDSFRRAERDRLWPVERFFKKYIF